eukprot:GEMP01033974.1.p1 GENE.GEMP01033974.1~~GEMP01033974.1.p1  ORF type:complete len:412 (+),score=95.52 GEMP01033974.1:85-1236(+)
MNAQMMGNPHQDVLSADVGSDEASNLRLLDEIKARAKGAFSSGDMLNCELLYSKALTIKEEVALYSNRAMVRLKMGRNDGALTDSEAAIKLDSTFIKGHYRKAMALRRLSEFDKALAACDAPEVKGNKEFSDLVNEIVADKKKADEEKAQLIVEAQDLTVDRPVPEPTRVPLNFPKKADAASKKNDEKASELRGYKTREDGKTTSYFHMDITEEAKNLIGDIRPQKLDAPIETTVDPVTGSAWNQGGTFESKSYKKWATEKLNKMFPIDVSIVGKSIRCEVTVPILQHDIEVICNRGKRRLVNDLTFVFEWIMRKDNTEFARGKITFENDGDGDYTPFVEVDPKTKADYAQLIDMTMKHAGSSVVQPEILKKIRELDAEFRKF